MVDAYYIRRLTGEDASPYQALRLEALRRHPEAFGTAVEDESQKGTQEVALRLEDQAQRWVLGAFLEVDQRLIGTIGVFRAQGTRVRHKGQVVGMYVTPELRQRGVGKSLLDGVIGRARHVEGLEILQLSVAANNNTAIRLYERAGFQRYGTEPSALKYDGRYWDELHMLMFL